MQDGHIDPIVGVNLIPHNAHKIFAFVSNIIYDNYFYYIIRQSIVYIVGNNLTM